MSMRENSLEVLHFGREYRGYCLFIDSCLQGTTIVNLTGSYQKQFGMAYATSYFLAALLLAFTFATRLLFFDPVFFR